MQIVPNEEIKYINSASNHKTFLTPSHQGDIVIMQTPKKTKDNQFQNDVAINNTNESRDDYKDVKIKTKLFPVSSNYTNNNFWNEDISSPFNTSTKQKRNANYTKHSNNSLIYDSNSSTSINSKHFSIVNTPLSSKRNFISENDFNFETSKPKQTFFSLIRKFSSKQNNINNKKHFTKNSSIVLLKYFFLLYPPYTITTIINKIAFLTPKLKFFLRLHSIMVKHTQEKIFYILKQQGDKTSINFYHNSITNHLLLYKNNLIFKPYNIEMYSYLINDLNLCSWQFYINELEITKTFRYNLYNFPSQNKMLLDYMQKYIDYYIKDKSEVIDNVQKCLVNRFYKEISSKKNLSLFGIARYLANFIKKYYDGKYCGKCYCVEEVEVCRCKCHYNNTSRNEVNNFFKSRTMKYSKDPLMERMGFIWEDEKGMDSSQRKAMIDKSIKNYNKAYGKNIGFISLLYSDN